MCLVGFDVVSSLNKYITFTSPSSIDLASTYWPWSPSFLLEAFLDGQPCSQETFRSYPSCRRSVSVRRLEYEVGLSAKLTHLLHLLLLDQGSFLRLDNSRTGLFALRAGTRLANRSLPLEKFADLHLWCTGLAFLDLALRHLNEYSEPA